MRGKWVCLHIVLLVVSIVFAGCGEDELLTDLQDDVSDLQNEINLLSVKAESAEKENDRLLADIEVRRGTVAGLMEDLAGEER